MQPYLIAQCQTKTETRAGMRCVMSAVASIGGGWTLFATCRHVFDGNLSNYMFFDRDKQPLVESYPELHPVVLAPASPVPDLDLIFVALRLSVPLEQMKVSDIPLEKGTELSHARAVIFNSDSEDVFHVSTKQTKCSQFKAAIDREGQFFYLNEAGEYERVKKAGAQTFYNVLEMESWPGVSGSPLWDRFGRIRGMVCGGDAEGGRLEDGIPRLVFLPAKILLREIEQVKNALKSGALF